MDLQIALEQRSKVEEFQRKHRVALLTLLFTDLVGSTQLKQRLGETKGVQLIQRYRAVVRQILRGFKEAEEIESAGDSFFLIFAKPSDAVRFSLLLQANLSAVTDEIQQTLSNRIGIHVGEVFVEEHDGAGKAKDLYGIQVDICARVMSLAEGDQILMTRSAFDNARQVLKGQDIEGVNVLSWLNHGPYLLKGVEESVEICEVGEVGQAVLKPPSDSEKVHRFVSPDAEPVLGWRPAIGQGVLGTSWVLEEKLGEGGFGEVWLGQHKTTKQRRVFKFCFRADRVRSLKREVTLFRVMKERLGEHPHIVGVQDVYLEEAPYYLTMEYVEGRDLKTWSEARGGVGAIPLEVRLEIVAQVADALQAACDAGVIHRDVKPSNILIAECRTSGAQLANPQSTICAPNLKAKLTDFGIGQVVSEEALAGMTRMGFTQTILFAGSSAHTGTQMYMAPELMAGKPASIRSDIYSLGVVLYQLLLGDFSRPLTTDWADDISHPLLREDLKHCFAGNAKDRFASGELLAKQLRSLQKRQAAREQETAAICAVEKAAYRRGIVRTTAVAGVIVGIMAVLVLVAVQQARRAGLNFSASEQARHRAERAEKRANTNLWQSYLSEASARRWSRRTGQRFASLEAIGKAAAIQPTVELRNEAIACLALIDLQLDEMWAVKLAQVSFDEKMKTELYTPAFLDFILQLEGNWHRSTSFCFDPDFQRYVRNDGQGNLRVYQTANDRQVNLLLGGGRALICGFSPDGRFLATIESSAPQIWLIVWELATSKVILKQSGVDISVRPVFSPDSRQIALWSEVKSVRYYDLATGNLLPESERMKERFQPSALYYNPDGSLIALLNGAGVLIKTVQGSTNILEFASFGGVFYSGAWTRDGRRFATGCGDGRIHIWDAVSGKLESKLEVGSEPVELAFDHAGNLLASANWDGTTRIWDTSTWQELIRTSDPAIAIQFSPDDRLFGMFLSGTNFAVCNVATGKEYRRLRCHTMTGKGPWGLDFDPSAQVLASSSSDGVRLWDLPSTKEIGFLPTGVGNLDQELKLDRFNSSFLAFDPKAHLMITTGSRAFCWPMSSAGTDQNVAIKFGPPQDISGGPYGRIALSAARLVALAAFDHVLITKLDDFSYRQIIGQGSFPHYVAISPDGRWVATCSWQGTKVQVWDVQRANSGSESPAIELPHPMTSEVCFTPDGIWLVTSHEHYRFWEVGTWKPGLVIHRRRGSEFPGPMDFTTDGKMMAIAYSRFVTRLMDPSTGKQFATLEDPDHLHISALRFSPDGSRLAIASENNAIQIWDLRLVRQNLARLSLDWESAP